MNDQEICTFDTANSGACEEGINKMVCVAGRKPMAIGTTRRKLCLHKTGARGLLLASAIGWLTTAAHAQSTAEPKASSELAAGSGDIVVTAQKRDQRAIDVPLAVTALDAKGLIQNNQVSLQDYYRNVPGLSLLDDGQGFKQIVIRGITTGFGNAPTFGAYIDDIPMGSSTAAARGDVLVPDLDPSDLKRIEVLKGPQGTLYGASNMGGLLKYVTTPPDTKRLSGRLESDGSAVAHGDAGYGVRAALNVPLIEDRLAIRISGSRREDPGFIDNVTGQSRDVNRRFTTTGRAALIWTPSDHVDLRLNALYQSSVGRGSGREDYDFATGRPVYGDLTQSRVPGINRDRETLRVYNGTVNLHFDWATLTSSTSYAQTRYHGFSDITQAFGPLFGPIFNDYLGIPDFGASVEQAYRTDKFTQEERLAGRLGRLDWLVGAFFTHERSNLYQDFHAIRNEDGQPLRLDGDLVDVVQPLGNSIGPSRYSEIAGFGDLTYHFTSKLSLQAGLRFSHNQQYSRSYSDGGLLGDANNSLGRSHESVVTFVVAPEYKLSNDASLYARVASGYRPGGPNVLIAGNTNVPAFQSDTTINYELGFKGYGFDRKIYVELSGFYIDWNDIQLIGENALNETFFENAGGAVSRGVEASGQYQPVSGLTIGGNFTFTDAHLTDPAPAGIAGATGDRLPFSPKYAWQVSADYNRALFADYRGTIGGDFSFQGKRQSDFERDFIISRKTLPSYTVLNLHAGLTKGRYEINLFAKNVADRRGFTSAGALTLSHAGAYGVSVIQPRTIGLSLVARL